jgi:YVTN family beta-propeller protein
MSRNLSYARILILGLALILVFGVISRSASAQQFIAVSYPGSPSTYPGTINNHGEIVGNYADSGGVFHGFTLVNGQYTSLNFPGSADTYASAINDSGEIVGAYLFSGTLHGFLFANSTYTTIDFPGSNYTGPAGINNLGEIVGVYSISGSSVLHGFALNGGVFTTIDFPGSNPSNYLNQVNNSGVIAGGYIDVSSIYHGFVYNAGTFTSINFPGAANSTVTGINDSGELFGVYCDQPSCSFFSPGPQKWFTDRNGQFTTVNVAASDDIANLNLEANNAGQLVAAYQDSAGNSHGAVSAVGPFAYVATGATGPCCALTVLDTSTNLVAATIPLPGLGGVPFAVSPDQTRIYIADGSTVEVIDVATNALIATVPGVGPNANAVAIAPNGVFGYTANYNPNLTTGSVSVFSTATNSVVASVPVPFAAGNVTVSPDSTLVYATGNGSVIAVINAATNVVASTFSIPVPAAGEDANFGPFLVPNGSVGYISQSVASVTPGTVTAISIPSNTTIATIPVGTEPQSIAITPDGASAYVGNGQSNNVSVINTRGNTVRATIPVGNQNSSSTLAITPDGALTYVTNSGDNTLSVIQNSTNSVVATIPTTGVYPWGIIIPAVQPTSQSITQPLSPTAPNTFNFGPHNFTVTYPAGANFSGVNMTVVAMQATPGSIGQRFAGTPFANALCIVYSGAGGNCVDYQVTCSTTSGSQITCPNESTPTIAVKTSYDTQQQIINPGFLTTPIGTNEWTNIFTAFYLQRFDPTTKARTSGFSEFVAVDLGATNRQGAGNLQFLPPLQQNNARVFPAGTIIPVQFQLTSVAQPSESISDATASITVVMISDANGNPRSNDVLDKSSAFAYTGGNYVYSLNTSGYAPGTYNITIYGNAFTAQQVQFTLPAATSGAHLITTLQSLTLNSATNQYVATISVSNTGTAAANGLIVTASELNTTATSTVLPVSLGNISSNGSATATLTYPASAGATGSRGSWTIGESFAGGSTGAAIRVVLP